LLSYRLSYSARSPELWDQWHIRPASSSRLTKSCFREQNIMNKRTLAFAFLLTIALAMFLFLLPANKLLHHSSTTRQSKAPTSSKNKFDARAVDSAPLSFEENHRQTNSSAKFITRGPGYAAYLNPTDATFIHRFHRQLPEFNPVASSAENALGFTAGTAAIHLQWIGANQHARVHGVGLQSGTSNYFIGNDRSKWRRKVPHYNSVQFDNLYPGIDLVYHGDQKHVEFDYRVAPGADPRSITIGVGTPSSVGITHEGELSIIADGDEFILRPPVAYQEFGGDRRLVSARYKMEDNHRVTFELGSYDQTQPLIIDPVLDFAASFGTGSNISILNSVAVDTSGNAYVAGETCDTNYPVTTGALESSGGSNVALECYDIVVSKFDPTGSSLLYSTYIGGTTHDSGAGRLLVDSAGELYLTGLTDATDFPTSSNAYQKQAKGGTCDYGPYLKQRNCADGLLLKLSADGSSLIFSTLLGGERIDMITALAIDPTTKNIYVTGATNSTAFPTAGTPEQATYGGGNCVPDDTSECYDAFIAKFSADGSSLLASTYYGGNDNDYGVGIALDSTGNVYVAGNSTSTNFKTSAGAFQTAHAGTTPQPDAFVIKLDSGLSTLQYSTLIGGGNYDLALAMLIDSTGSVYITGSTASSDFPTTAGVFQTAYAGPAGADCPDEADTSVLNQPSCGDAFVAKLNPAGSALTFSTYVGGASPDIALNLALDSSKNVWIFGDTASSDFPYTSDAYYQPTNPTLFLTELSPDGKTEIFSTPFGNGGLALGLTIDPSDNVFIAGQSPTVSVTPGAYSTNNGGGVFLAKFSPGSARPGVQLSATTLSFVPPSVVTPINTTSAPQSVTLTNNGTATLHLQVLLTVEPYQTTPNAFIESDDCPSTLAANASCTINVAYSPIAVATQDFAFVQITSDAPNAPHSITAIGSSGTIDSASFTPATLTFTGQAPGSTSAAQTSFLNTSTPNQSSYFARTAALPVLSGANASDFQVDSSQCPINTAFCTVSVTFKPAGATPTSRTATVSVATDAPNSPQVLTLNGTVSSTPVIVASTYTALPTVVGQTYNTGFNVMNVGGGTLNVSNLVFSGANASDFQASTVTCSVPTFTLASQAACNLGIAFTPSATGNRTATLTFTDNETNPTSVTLTGYGASSGGPQLQLLLSATPYNGQLLFPDSVVGHTTNYNIALVTILNTASGGANSGAHITGATLTGDFSQTNNCPVPPAQLTAQQNCTYTVIFSPTAVGARTGTLTINTDAPGNPSFSANFLGNGVTVPSPVIAPSLLDFGPQVSGTTSAAQTLTLTNSGNGALTFAAPVVSGPFSISANTCASPLAVGANCTFSIKFSAPSKGPASGFFGLTTNAAGATLSAALHGNGVTGPFPNVSPKALSFGKQAVNTTSAPQAITLSNAGDTTFNLSGVGGSENFKQTNNCGASLAPGTTCTINVSFAPGNDTFPDFTANGQVFITTNATGSPISVPLTGTPEASTGAATTTSLTSSQNPSTVGQSVTFTATVSSQTAGTLTGSVTFLDGANTIGTGTVAAGKATFATTSLTQGTHSIIAMYGGDSNFAPSGSNTVSQVVNGGSLAATTTTLALSKYTISTTEEPTLTATVASQTAGTISGTVTFLDGTTQLGSGPVSNGSVAFTPTSTLTAGTHSLTASYGGDTKFAASTSSAATLTVNAAPTSDFTVATAPSSLSLAAGASGTSTISVAPVNGATLSVALSCGTLPAKVSCTINPASLTLDGTHTATATATIGTMANTSIQPFETPSAPRLPPVPLVFFVSTMLALFLFLAAGAIQNERPKRVLVAGAMLVLTLAVVSCSGGGSSSSSNGTAPGTYTINLTGASTSPALSHSTPLAVTVTK
jgi:hypothetical protein